MQFMYIILYYDFLNKKINRNLKINDFNKILNVFNNYKYI